MLAVSCTASPDTGSGGPVQVNPPAGSESTATPGQATAIANGIYHDAITSEKVTITAEQGTPDANGRVQYDGTITFNGFEAKDSADSVTLSGSAPIKFYVGSSGDVIGVMIYIGNNDVKGTNSSNDTYAVYGSVMYTVSSGLTYSDGRFSGTPKISESSYQIHYDEAYASYSNLSF